MMNNGSQYFGLSHPITTRYFKVRPIDYTADRFCLNLEVFGEEAPGEFSYYLFCRQV